MSGKSYKGVVSENVEKEYKSFFEDEMKKSKEEIFYDNYRIHFYVELRDFLMSDNDLDDEYYEKLASEKDSLLALLYDDFFGQRIFQHQQLGGYDRLFGVVLRTILRKQRCCGRDRT